MFLQLIMIKHIFQYMIDHKDLHKSNQKRLQREGLQCLHMAAEKNDIL